VPETFSSPNSFPGDFFNFNAALRARGNVFDDNPEGQFQVSANPDNPNRIPPRFWNIHYTYPDMFAAFSPETIFTPTGSRTYGRPLFLPSDQTTPASVAASERSLQADRREKDAPGCHGVMIRAP
jgi:hypothetical protein